MPPKTTARGGAAARGRGRGGTSSRGGARGAAKAGAAGRGGKANVRGGAKAPAKKAPEKPKWTKEQIDAATKIQKRYRRYRTLKEEEGLRKKKEEMDRLMEEAERAAWLYIIKMEKEQADREHEKWLQQERERKEGLKRMKMMLECAFDGELEDIQNIQEEAVKSWHKQAKDGEIHPTRLARKIIDLLDCTDANNYTPLSEAAAGGAENVIEWLALQGANPNSVGQYGRTPIYRAAFAGHVAAVQQLLQCGADPTAKADDGGTAGEIATNPTIRELLQEWDIADTERLLSNLDMEREKRAAAQAEYVQMKCDAIQDKINKAEEIFKNTEKQMVHAYQELNKRIVEHDECTAKGTHVEVTLQTVHDAEDLVVVLKDKVEVARKDLQLLRLELREQQKIKMEETAPIGIEIRIKELEEVLIRDVGNKIREDGRWPLIIDESGQASIFVRYTDTNYINALNPANMEIETIRIALLGAARFGKPFVIDLMGVDMWHIVEERFKEIKEDLLESVLDKTFLSGEKFIDIVKEADGPEYEKKENFWARMDDFKFWVLTNADPDPALLEKFYVIRDDGPEYENFEKKREFWDRKEYFQFWVLTEDKDPDPELMERFYVIRVKPSGLAILTL